MSDRQGTLQGDEARSRLYEVLGSDRPLADRLERALEIGVAYFGVDLGYVAEVEAADGDWEVIVSTDPPDGPVPAGHTEDLMTTYCRRTIQQEDVLSIADAPAEGWGDDPAFEVHGQHCYHGAPIIVDGETFGTVCFAATDPRAEPFSEAEKSFTHLVAQMAGYQLEQERFERELARRERELDERAAVYRAVIDASFDLVFRVDRDGQITSHVESVEEVLGYPPATFEGKPFTAVFADDRAAERAQELFDRVLAGETVEELALPFGTAGGDQVYVDIRATPIYRGDVPEGERTPGDIVAVQGMAREATERKRREGLNRVLNRVLRHNLRNDVNVISGLAELLEERLSGEEASHARRILAATDQLIGLSETARKLEESFDDAPAVEPLDVVPLVERTAGRIDEQYPGASVAVDAPAAAVAETAPRLETALWELLDNAGKHAGPAATIDVTVRSGDDRVAIRVADDGPGLPAQERAVLTAGDETPLVHGSGLGLWLVYWLVTGIDGDLVVLEEAAGASVEVRLPRAVGDD